MKCIVYLWFGDGDFGNFIVGFVVVDILIVTGVVLLNYWCVEFLFRNVCSFSYGGFYCCYYLIDYWVDYCLYNFGKCLWLFVVDIVFCLCNLIVI